MDQIQLYLKEYYQALLHRVDQYVGADQVVVQSEETRILTNYLRDRAEAKFNSMLLDLATSGTKGWFCGHVIGCFMPRQIAVGLCMGLMMGHTAEQHLNAHLNYNMVQPQRVVIYEQVHLQLHHFQKGDFSDIYSLDDQSHCTQPLKDLQAMVSLNQSCPDQYQVGALHYLLAKLL